MRIHIRRNIEIIGIANDGPIIAEDIRENGRCRRLEVVRHIGSGGVTERSILQRRNKNIRYIIDASAIVINVNIASINTNDIAGIIEADFYNRLAIASGGLVRTESSYKENRGFIEAAIKHSLLHVEILIQRIANAVSIGLVWIFRWGWRWRRCRCRSGSNGWRRCRCSSRGKTASVDKIVDTTENKHEKNEPNNTFDYGKSAAFGFVHKITYTVKIKSTGVSPGAEIGHGPEETETAART